MEAVYLDTHMVLWLHIGDLKKLSGESMALIEGSAVFCSSFIALELQFLYEMGRLNFTPTQILDDLRESIQLEQKNSPIGELIQVANKQTWTRDPFDRLITAQASLLRLPLITKDQTILQHYPLAMW